MSVTLIVHIMNTDPIVGEVDEVPSARDRLLVLKNPRQRDGKDLENVSDNLQSILIPVDRVLFVEAISGEAEEEIFSFVRE